MTVCTEKQITVTATLLKLFKSLGKTTVCSRRGCGKPFLPGDLIVSRSRGKKYHVQCYEEMYIDLGGD